jgi:hypothetical protein
VGGPPQVSVGVIEAVLKVRDEVSILVDADIMTGLIVDHMSI